MDVRMDGWVDGWVDRGLTVDSTVMRKAGGCIVKTGAPSSR